MSLLRIKMERFETVSLPVTVRGGIQITSALSPCPEVKDVDSNDPLNYFVALQRAPQARKRDRLQDSRSWEGVVGAACTLSALERRFLARKTCFGKQDFVPHTSTSTYTTQLKQLDEALDKLLSSFHSVAYDPIDTVYSPSLCVASSRDATETVSNVLALVSCVEAASASLDKFTQVTRDGASFASSNIDAPSACLHASEQLDVFERELDALEDKVNKLKGDLQGSSAVFNAINGAYAASAQASVH